MFQCSVACLGKAAVFEIGTQLKETARFDFLARRPRLHADPGPAPPARPARTTCWSFCPASTSVPSTSAEGAAVRVLNTLPHLFELSLECHWYFHAFCTKPSRNVTPVPFCSEFMKLAPCTFDFEENVFLTSVFKRFWQWARCTSGHPRRAPRPSSGLRGRSATPEGGARRGPVARRPAFASRSLAIVGSGTKVASRACEESQESDFEEGAEDPNAV